MHRKCSVAFRYSLIPLEVEELIFIVNRLIEYTLRDNITTATTKATIVVGSTLSL